MAHSSIEDIPEARFTEATIKRMYRLADKGKTDPEFQKLVYGIVNERMNGQWKNYRRELETVFNWFKRAADYRRDPDNVELLQDVWATLDRQRFDCDDASIWLCAAFEVLGAPCRFVTVSTRSDGEPSHVFVETFVGGRWEGADASIQHSSFGWSPQNGVKSRMVWDRKSVGLSGGDISGVEGLGMHDSNPDGWTDDLYNAGPETGREGGFAADRLRFNPTGAPDDISNTFAPGRPGDASSPDRVINSELVESVADERVQLRTTDPAIPYPSEGPVESYRGHDELFHDVPRADVPKNFDLTRWSGAVPDYDPDPSYMLPDSGGRPMSGLAGNHLTDADYERLERQIRDRISGHLGEYVTRHGLSGLGADMSAATITASTSLAQTLATMISGGELPKDTSVVNQAIDVGAKLYADRIAAEAAKDLAEKGVVPAYKPPTVTPTASKIPSWLIPAGVVAAVVVVGLAMSRR